GPGFTGATDAPRFFRSGGSRELFRPDAKSSRLPPLLQGRGLRSAPEPAGDAVAVVARPGADQRDLVHLRHAEQAQRVPVRDEGVDDIATLVEELQLPAPVGLPVAAEVDDVGERAVLVLRAVVVHVEEVALAIARRH